MRGLLWLGVVFEVGVAFHLLDHLRRGLPPFVATTAVPFLIVGPLALFGIWRGHRWGAALMALVAAAGLTLGVWEHLISCGPDHLAAIPWPSALLTVATLGVTVPLGWRSLRVVLPRLDRDRAP